jgi:nucleoside-diphosphate-sugar epimerase
VAWSDRWSGSAIRSLPDLQASSAAVFVAGATGFIGQHLVATLLEQGFSVRAMIRPQKNTDPRIPPGCEQVPVDLTDVDKLAGIVAQSSAVVYCAGSVRGRNSADFSTANIEGVKTILGALERATNAPPLLLLSSLAADRPQLSHYARSKYEGELLLSDRSSLNWTIFRPPAVYGPGDREMMPLLKMIRRGLLVHAGPRNQRLSLLHVEDLVDAIVSWLSAPQRYTQKTYAIDDGTPGGYSWTMIGEAVCGGKFRMLKAPGLMLNVAARANLFLSALLGYAPMLTPGKVRELIQPDWLCDNHDFTKVSGWTPRLDLKRGVDQLFKSKSNGLSA